MHDEFNIIVNHITHMLSSINRIRFPDNVQNTHPLAFQVNFPRLEIVIKGELRDKCLQTGLDTLSEHDVLYVPTDGWNFPDWHSPATTMSILFGKQQMGFSVQEWDGENLKNICKENVPRRGPRVGSFLLQALNEMMMSPDEQRIIEQRTARYIVTSLLCHCLDLSGSQILTASRSNALFNSIREYIDGNFKSPLTRESVASEFYISPNYLSHLFQKKGSLGFNEYLNYVRLEHAKALLKGYDLKIKEIACICGFIDSNYFCRTFRKKTDRSPSEYRRQYHSQIKGKN